MQQARERAAQRADVCAEALQRRTARFDDAVATRRGLGAERWRRYSERCVLGVFGWGCGTRLTRGRLGALLDEIVTRATCGHGDTDAPLPAPPDDLASGGQKGPAEETPALL
jgi:hypothetical protein